MNHHPAAGSLATAIAGGGLLVVGAAVGCVPLLVTGMGLVMLALAAPLIVLPAGRGVRVSRRLVSRRVLEGVRVEAVVSVARGRGSLVRGELHDPLLARPQPLGRLRRTEVRVHGLAPRRGRHRLPAPRVLVSDPLGLVRVSRAGGGEEELLVLPRLEPVRWETGGRRGAASGTAAGARAGTEPIGPGDIDGVRPYRDGTPASRIHWPALARGAGLLERRVQPAGERWPVVALDPRCAADPDVLDSAVRAAASLAAELARRGGVRLALPGDRRPTTLGPDLAAWPAAHARLALLTSQVMRGPALPDADLLFLVRASGEAPVGVPERGRTILVLPGRVAGSGARVLEVAGCIGYDVVARPPARLAA